MAVRAVIVSGVCVVLAALAACGGSAFVNGSDVEGGTDAGAAETTPDLSADGSSTDSGGATSESSTPGADGRSETGSDASSSPPPDGRADSGADTGHELEAAAVDGGADAHDASSQHEAAAPPLCCQICAAAVTIDAGFVCAGGACVVGVMCTPNGASCGSGAVITCP